MASREILTWMMEWGSGQFTDDSGFCFHETDGRGVGDIFHRVIHPRYPGINPGVMMTAATH